jgi:hypothetical protein
VRAASLGSLLILAAGSPTGVERALDTFLAPPPEARPPTVVVPEMVALLLEASPPVASLQVAQQPPALALPRGASIIKQAILCDSIDKRNLPPEHMTGFLSGTPQVELYLECETGERQVHQLTVEWYKGDKCISRQLLTVSGRRRFMTGISATNERGLREGEYEVRVLQGSEEVERLDFRIGE